MRKIDEQLQVIRRGIVEIIPEDELRDKLEKKKTLRIKWGADPSAPDLHLGHTVVLNKLRQFQELGHEVFFIIGDFTAQIGDPSGRSETRKPLSPEEAEKNAKTYQAQVFKILDPSKTRVVYNSKWLAGMNLAEVLKLSAQYTVARMLERKDFKERFERQAEISILEFIYPLLQGYDSVYLKADVEIGGTDQKFNMLMGRTLQQRFGQEPQVIITLPILEGTDGAQKMSKSLGNYIGLTEPPSEIYGKIMSISDELMFRYYELLTDVSLEEIKKMHPKEAKKQLGRILVSRFYSEEKAKEAEEEFEAIFKEGKLPQKIESILLPYQAVDLLTLLLEAKLVSSKSQARRLVEQGGVAIDNKIVRNAKAIISLDSERLIRVGKRNFVRVSKE
ncbi:MAG: tyrosine--tRNA ligase [Candidatus Margulisiibacteriota bacterium]